MCLEGKRLIDHRPERKAVEVVRMETAGGWTTVFVRLECGHHHRRDVRATWRNPRPRTMRCGLCADCQECRAFFWFDLSQQQGEQP